MPELRLENVNYSYKGGNGKALSGVSCGFSGGVVSAVIGPSGSGKTTLLSLMAGLDRPSEGKILFNGEDLSTLDLDRYRREDVSMVFQAFQLFPLLTALENVCYPMDMKGAPDAETKTQARQLLNSVGIRKKLYRRYPANLSGGEQQRVAIARALATGAQMILADEPTGNLDTENGTRIMEILIDLAHNHGYGVVIVTHDPAIAEASDSVHRLTDGMLERA
jgi:putative ABC transport system ATP-binding protein